MLDGTTALRGSGNHASGRTCKTILVEKPSVSRAARTFEGPWKQEAGPSSPSTFSHLNCAESPGASKRRQVWYKGHHRGLGELSLKEQVLKKE